MLSLFIVHSYTKLQFMFYVLATTAPGIIVNHLNKITDELLRELTSRPIISRNEMDVLPLSCRKSSKSNHEMQPNLQPIRKTLIEIDTNRKL